MDQKIFFRPAIAFLAPLILGIATGTWFEGHSKWAIATILASAAYMFYAVLAKKQLLVAPLIFFLSLGYVSIQPWSSPSIPEHHIINYAEPFRWNITGTVCNDPEVAQNGRIRFVIMVESLQDIHNDAFPVVGKIRVTSVGELPSGFQPGDRISFPGKIRAIRNFYNPGGFDYERFMAFKTIFATSYVVSDKIKLLERHHDQNMKQQLSEARIKVATIIDMTHADEASAAVMKALVIGDRTGISKELREAFNKSGMGHLLAISGLHVGIVASFSFLLFSRFFSLSRTFLDHAWTFKASALLSIVPVTLYGLLAGMSPSTQRAVIMISVFLMTFLIRRRQDSINTLAIAALAILIFHPPALFSISFQLSFTAVFAILFGFSRMGKSETRFDTHFPIQKKISAFFLASLFAILGSLPLVMYYFNQVSLVGIFANFILVPLIGFLVVPIGLISVFFLPFSQAISSIGFQAGGFFLSHAINVVHFFSNLAFSSVKTVTPSMLEISLYYLMTGYLFYFVTHHRSIIDATKALINEGFRLKGPVIIISTLAMITAADISYWIYTRFFHQDLRITIVDVGQGNAAIVEFPGGKTMMIDGGGFYDNNIFDVGERIIAPLLWQKKIKTVDTLILTHPDSDHLNGLLYIARHFNVKTVRTNGEPSQTVGYQEFIKIIHEKNIQTPEFSALNKNFEVDGVNAYIFYPPEDFIERKKNESWRDTNSSSMVIKLEMGEFSCLFTGDIKAKSEAELLSISNDDLESLVLIAPHHGSKTSSTKNFLDSVKPETVIFCAGWNNRFNLPNEQVIKRYRKRDVRIFRTDYNGAVTIRTDGISTRITPFLTADI
jgi:competence protein ComEC